MPGQYRRRDAKATDGMSRRKRQEAATEPERGQPQPVEVAAPEREVGRRAQYAILAAILLAGLLLRGAYLAEILGEPDFAHPAMDPLYNDYWARGIVTGDWTPPEGYPDPLIPSTPHGRPPGYPWFLAAVYFVTGGSYLAPRLIQMALGLTNAALMFFLGRALFGRAVGLIASAFMATYWVFVHFEGEITYPAVSLFVLMVFMLSLVRWARRPTIPGALVAGLLFGLYGLFRPNVFLFGPVLVAWFWWVLGGRPAFRRWFAMSAVLTVATVAAIAPALIRNLVVAGDFVFLSSYGGVNLWVGHNDDTDCVTPKIPGLKDFAGFEDWSCFHYPLIVRGLGRKLGKPDLKFSEANTWFYQQGRSYILRHPIKTIGHTITKALIFWGPTETTNDKVLHWVKRKSTVLRWLPGFPAVFALFGIGLTLFVRDWRRGRFAGAPQGRLNLQIAAMLALFILVYCISVIIYFVAGRYRMPVIPFLLLFGAYGVHGVWRMAQAAEYRRAGAWALAGLGLFAVDSIQFHSYQPDLAIWHQHRAKAFEQAGYLDSAVAEVHKELEVNPHYADGWNFLGKLLEKQGLVDESMEAYRKTLEHDPNNALALNNLGYLLAEKGADDEALQCYQKALEVNPLLTLAYNNRGNLLKKLGRPDEALDDYAKALEIDPSDRFADYNMGDALAALGRHEEALAHYRRAMELDARNPDIPNNLGLALAALGRHEEAMAAYRRALELDPAYANAHNNLGYLLADMGRREEAEREYEEALRLDHNLSIALNNLGNLHADMGDLAKAEALFKRALAADPNDRFADYNLGNLRARQGDVAAAETHLRRAVEKNPTDPNAPNNLGLLLATQKRYAEAVEYYQEALKRDPRYARAWFNIANVLGEQGRFAEAIEHYEKALALQPDYPEARRNLETVQNAARQGAR